MPRDDIDAYLDRKLGGGTATAEPDDIEAYLDRKFGKPADDGLSIGDVGRAAAGAIGRAALNPQIIPLPGQDQIRKAFAVGGLNTAAGTAKGVGIVGSALAGAQADLAGKIVGEAPARLAGDMAQHMLRQSGQEIGRHIERAAASMGYVRSTGPMGVAEDVAGAVPQLVGGVGAGALGTLAGGPLAGMATGAGFFALTDAGTQTSAIYERLRAEGMSDEDASARATQAGAMYGAASGVLEFVGVGSVLRGTKLLKHVRRAATTRAGRLAEAGVRAAGAGAGEGLTEAAQGVLGEGAMAWARDDWDEFKRTWNDLDTRGREFMVGAILGVGVRGGVEAIDLSRYSSAEDLLADIEVEPQATPSQSPESSDESSLPGGVAGAVPSPSEELTASPQASPQPTPVRVVEPLPGAAEPMFAVVPDERMEQARARGEAESAAVTEFARRAGRDMAAQDGPAAPQAVPRLDQPQAEAQGPASRTPSVPGTQTPEPAFQEGAADATSQSPADLATAVSPSASQPPSRESTRGMVRRVAGDILDRNFGDPEAVTNRIVRLIEDRAKITGNRERAADGIALQLERGEIPFSETILDAAKQVGARIRARTNVAAQQPAQSETQPELPSAGETQTDDRYKGLGNNATRRREQIDTLIDDGMLSRDNRTGEWILRIDSPGTRSDVISAPTARELVQIAEQRGIDVRPRSEREADAAKTERVLSGLRENPDIYVMSRAQLLREAAALGVSEGPKSLPALRKRVGEARARSGSRPADAVASQPDSSAPSASPDTADAGTRSPATTTPEPTSAAEGMGVAASPDSTAGVEGVATEKKGTGPRKFDLLTISGRDLVGQFFGPKVQRGKTYRNRNAPDQFESPTLAGSSRTIDALFRMRKELGDFALKYRAPHGGNEGGFDLLGVTDGEFTLFPEVFNIDPATLADGQEVLIDWKSLEETRDRHRELTKKGKPALLDMLGMPKEGTSGITVGELADRVLLQDTQQPQREEGPQVRRKSVSERILAAAEKIESDARAANAKLNIPRGRNIGATLPPAYYANLVKIGAAKIMKGVANFAEWAAEMKADIGAFRVNMRKLYTDSTAEYRRLIDAGSFVEESGKPVKAIVRETTGQTDTSPKVETTEAKALKARLSAEEKASALAYRAGLRAARDELPAIRAKLRDAVKAKGDARAAVIQGVRDEIRHLVETNLPPEFRGRFLSDVTTATSMGDIARTIQKLRRESARATGQQDFRQIKNMQRFARLLPRRRPDGSLMSPREAFDAGLREAMELAEKLKRSGRAVVTTKDIEAAADRLMELKSEMGGAVADAMAAKRLFMAVKRGTAEQHAQELAAAIRTREALKSREGDADDLATPLGRRLNLQLADLRNVTEALEGGQGVAHSLMVRNMQTHHEAYLTSLRDASEQLERLARAAGFTNTADAVAQLSGRRGEGVTQRTTAVLGGREWKIAKGELMSLYALDPQTRSRIRGGSPLQFSRGKRRTPIHATLEEIDAATGALTAQERALVDGLKILIESKRDELFEAHFRLKGFYPDAVEGYWPSKRNTRFSPQRGLPEGWRGISQKYIENVGFLKEREGGQLPYVVGDAMTVAMEHIDASLKVIHLAEATRDAASVMLNPEVVAAVNERFGTAYNKAIEDFLMAVSLANEADSTTAGRIVQWMNQNLAVSSLGLNPGTWFKQLGGIARLRATMPKQAFRDGWKNWRSIKTDDLISGSGYFWSRYVGNIAGRWSPVGGDDYADVAKATGKLGLDEAVANAVSAWQNKSLSDAFAALNQVRNVAAKSLEVLNAFDAVNARIAYAGWLGEAKRRYPAWDEETQSGWAMTHAANTIRETQNSSSVLDAPLIAVQQRERALSAFLVFQSDILKARNRLIAARRSGAFKRQVAAEAVNILWGRAVGWGYAAAITGTILAAGGDEDDAEEWRKKYLSIDRQLWDLASDVAGLGLPVIGPEAIAAFRYHGSELNAPALEVVNRVWQALIATEEDFADMVADDGTAGDFAAKLGKFANEFAGAIGVNPLKAIFDRALRQIDAQVD